MTPKQEAKLRGAESELCEVRALRRRAGLTQQELARAAGVSQSLIAKLEAGLAEPRFSTGQRILAALHALSGAQEPAARELMQTRVVSCEQSTSLKQVLQLMKQHGISAVPVLESGRVVGVVSERSIVSRLDEVSEETSVAEVMEDAPIVPVQTPRSVLAKLLQHFSLVIVGEGGACAGIVTKADLLAQL